MKNEYCEPTLPSLGIKSTKHLAYALGIHSAMLTAEANRAARYYAPFVKTSAPAPFAKLESIDKKRLIDNPTDVLKEVQSRINRRLLQPLALPYHIFGGVGGKCTLQNISLHAGARVLVTMDIKEFFPSISNLHVYKVWNELLDCSPKVSALLTKLTTFRYRLPLGAPTSCMLANLVLFSKDGLIRHFCSKNGIVYSTWIDDLAFSGADSRKVIGVAVETFREAGFSLPHRKLIIMPAHRQQKLIGIVFNEHAGIPKTYLRAVRSGIHKLASGAILPKDTLSYVRALGGKINYIRSINTEQARSLEVGLHVAVEKAPR